MITGFTGNKSARSVTIRLWTIFLCGLSAMAVFSAPAHASDANAAPTSGALPLQPVTILLVAICGFAALQLIVLFLGVHTFQKRRIQIATLLETVTDAAFMLNRAGIIHGINTNACRLTGWSREEACGKPVGEILQLFTPAGRVSISELVALSIESGQAPTGEDRYILSDREGREYHVTCRFTPCGKRAGGVLILFDLNRQVLLEEQLRQSQKLESVGRLAGGIAHDFNNMIGAISGTAEVMMLQLDEDDGLMRYVRRIFATATKASDLTTRLLSFTRKGAGNVSASFCLNSIVSEAIEIIERSMDPQVEIKTDIPSAALTIIGDPSGIENAVINLCLNANDAMPKGGQLSITLGAQRLEESLCGKAPFTPTAGEFAVLTVRDTGVGIPPERLEKIFEPFFTTKEPGKGSGLGLAAVYSTVREHRGTFTVESIVGAGTTFRLFLPLAAGQAPERLEPESATPIRRGSGTILLVDDEEFMRDAGKLLLESLGYSVLLAENGKEAVDRYKEKRREIDIVILDMVMPRMNGSDAFKLIIEINPAAKVIIASGFARETGITTLFAKGLKAFIKKPYRQSEIAEILADILEEE